MPRIIRSACWRRRASGCGCGLDYRADLFARRPSTPWRSALPGCSRSRSAPSARSALSTFSRSCRAPHHPARLERHRARRPTPPCRQLFAEQAARPPTPPRSSTRTRPSLRRARPARQPAGASSAMLGVGPETIVGLCVERSLDLVVALLGILKAGAAYLPLDPDYPPRPPRLHARRCAGPVLLTQSAQLCIARSDGCAGSAPLIVTSMPMRGHRRAPATRPEHRIDPQHHRLCHLHLRLHRTAERRRCHACGSRQSMGGREITISRSARATSSAGHGDQLRCRRMGGLASPLLTGATFSSPLHAPTAAASGTLARRASAHHACDPSRTAAWRVCR